MNYLLTALASIIGVLVIALKLQGGKLHEAQIKLLLTTIDRGQSEKDKAVAMAKEQLQSALKDYYGSKHDDR